MSVTPSCPQMEQTLIGLLKIKTGDKLECQIGKREGYTPNPGVTRPLHFPQRKDPNTTYEKVEHPADSVIEREAGRGKYQ